MKTLYALYPDPDSAQLAADGLKKAGVEACDIAVLGSEPFDDYEFFRPDSETPMPWLAALGGLIGGVGGFLLASFTQKAYPLPTGGMPIVSMWTDGIITYETTMLGAILATFVTLLVAARLPYWRGWKSRLYNPGISNGMILVGVLARPEDSRAEFERILREAGATEIKEFVSR